MKTGTQRLYIDYLGYCSDGTNMYDWNTNRLISVINGCYYTDIVDLAKRILKQQQEKITKAIN